MYQLHYIKTLVSSYESHTKISNIHKHHTRNVDKIKNFFLRVNKPIGQGQIAYRGIKFWAELDLTLKKSQ